MKYKKLLQWGLPLLGLTAISISLPVALTSCSGDKVLEPINPDNLQSTTNNFTNSYKKVTILTNQQAADADLMEQFNKLSDAQKQTSFSNDLMNYVNSIYQYGDTVFLGMIGKNVTFNNYQGHLAQMLALFKMKGDPNTPKELDSNYEARWFIEPQVNNIKWANNKLSFTFVMNSILQVRNAKKQIIAQVNIVTTTQYDNLTVKPIALKKASGEDNRNYATWIITSGNLTVTQNATDIITSQDTPIDYYFKSNINETFYTQDEINSENPQSILANGFKLFPKSTHQINANEEQVLNLGISSYYWDLAFNADKPISIDTASPLIFLAPSLNSVYQYNGTVSRNSGSSPSNSSGASSH